MKTLICAGDSYTDRYRTTNNFDKVWPNFLAEKTKPKHLINIGSSGAGNYENTIVNGLLFKYKNPIPLGP